MSVQPLARRRLFLAVVSVSCLLAAMQQSSAIVTAQAADRLNVLITFASTPGPADQALVRAAGGQLAYTYRVVPGMAASLPAQAVTALANNPRIVAIEPDGRVQAYQFGSEYEFAWGVGRIGSESVHASGLTGAGVRVAVFDSGVEYSHFELAHAWAGGYDFANGDADPVDDNGHGTHVAGTVAAAADGQWVVGVAPNVQLHGVKVLDAAGGGDWSDVVAGLDWAVLNGIQVTNHSYGDSSNPGSLVEQAFVNSAAAGMVHVAAAGNTGNCRGTGNAVGYPARFDAVIAVGATDELDGHACFSSSGPAVELSAPGTNIISSYWHADIAIGSGTSMASPHVAGAAALVLSHRPTLTPLELKTTLLLSVDKKPAFSGSVKTGGRLNVARALGQEVKPPTGLTASSPSHSGGWSANSTVHIVWSGATDENGIGGYSYAFSPVTDFVPDEVKDADASATTLTMPLPDGEHWFHLRAGDSQGNWGTTVHVGPIRIDTFQPVRPVPSSPSHQVGGASPDRTIDVAWSGGSDAQSGLDGYAVSWTQGRAGSPAPAKNVEETVSRLTSPQLAVGAWWFNIRAVDNAGNWSDAVSVGPFSIRSGPTACAVPRLRGLKLLAAKRLLAKRGCSLGRVSRARSRRVARGRVVAQRPAPGRRLARGARVRVTLSRGRR